MSYLGVEYAIDGTRCSGDAHTSIGNGLINAINTYACLRHVPHELWTSVHEGDDGVIATRLPTGQGEKYLLVLGCLGFSVKNETHNQLNDVSFCGRHWFVDGATLRDHADIIRSLEKFHTAVSNCRADALLLAKAMSYYHTDAHTPLIGPLTWSITQVLRHKIHFSPIKRALHAYSKERWLQTEKILVNDPRTRPSISHDARVSCHRRTGISPRLQVELEAAYYRMADVDEILVLPKISKDWVMRPDGHVYGEPVRFVRDQ